MSTVATDDVTIKRLRRLMWALTPSERAYCWRIVLSGKPDVYDMGFIKIETSVGRALYYLTLNGDIP